LTLSWTALFVLSLLLQYFSFAAAPSVLAVHDEGLFELDGNTVANNASPPIGPAEDWDSHPGATGNRSLFITDGLGLVDDIFTGGSSKDDLNTTGWKWKTGSVQDKDDIEHAFAVSYDKSGHTFVYFGLDRFSNGGDAFTGFWFFKNGISKTAAGGFTPAHTVGDLLVQADFTNGGAASTINLYEWVGSGGDTNGTLNKLASGQICTGAPVNDKACAVTNTGPINPSWPFDDKGQAGTNNLIPANSFFEGGIDLDNLFGGKAPCFSSFLAETRSSQAVDSTLSDVATGDFNTCVPPTLATQSSTATADFGGTVSDTATLSGNDGPASGSVAFFICTPAQVTAAGCPAGSGSQVGSAVAVTTSANGGTATSSNYTVGLTSAAVGKYCWRAEYTPDQASQYLATKHTNATTECFTVAPATIDITKTANPAGPVNAGDTIGFDVTVTNTGTGTALGVTVNDPLPAGINWSIVPASADCSISGAVGSQVLGCGPRSLAAGASFSVHIQGATDPADCGTVTNADAHVTTSNDGDDHASASVVVNCPDIKVEKTPDNGTVQAGQNATFTIVVTNLGPGTANDVTLSDNLPAGYTWSVGGADGASCSINTAPNPDVLSCTFGTMASGATKTITLTALTSGANCDVIPNTATAASSNEPSNKLGNNSDSGSIDVLCANVTIVKDANPVGPVSAGDEIGFDITVTNNGDGIATDVHVSDPLPGGITWTADAPTGDTTGLTCNIVAGALVCNDASMGAGESFKVHIHGVTDAADCGTINNTASVTTGNDGSGSDPASVVVQCPDISVVKSGNGPLIPGDTATFTITVSNAGPGQAKNVHVADTLPGGVNWAIVPPVAGCSIAAGALSCDFASLAAGAHVDIVISGTVDNNDCGPIPNHVTVSASNEPAGATGNNSADATIVVQCADVSVVKTADVSPISAGQNAAFSITVTNNGPDAAVNVVLNDTLPAGVAWTVSNVTKNGSTVSNPCAAISGGTLHCDLGDMANGDVFVIHIGGETDFADCGTLHNVVTIGADNEPAGAGANNTDDADVVVNCPVLGIAKSADHQAPVLIGSQIGFTITVANNGQGTAFNVHVSDTLNPDFSWSIQSHTGALTWSLVGNALTASGDLPPGTSSVHVVAQTSVENSATQCGPVPNTAFLTQGEAAIGNDSASESVRCPAIGIDKTSNDADGIVDAGQTVTFTIHGSVSDGPVTNGTITDTLPVGETYVAGSQSSTPAADSFTVSADGRTLTWSYDSLANGDPAVTVTYDVTIDAAAQGALTNVAELCVSEVPTCVSDDETVTPNPQIGIDKASNDADGKVDPGQTVTFTIHGIVSSNPVTGAVVTDTLPVGQTYVAGSESSSPMETSFNASADGRTLTWTYASLAVGDPAVTITYDVTIDSVASGALINVAELCVSEVPDCVSADATVNPTASLGIQKSNNAPLVATATGTGTTVDLPTAKEGDTVTYTLDYTVTGAVHHAVITDVLPAGVTYTAGTASSDAQFTFQSYDTATRTLTWKAAEVTENGSLHYDATIDAGAAEHAQPLVNVATIDSDETEPASDNSPVFVPPAPEALTPPPTDTLAPSAAPSNPGFALMLILLSVAAFALAIGFITPVPEHVRRRDRLG
jgi:uncharacterized repeat protein (TIGR01451 family)/fimbrial isopeptide formation D2 family protein